jgi:PPOX class probable F420-dependent enzyme
MELSTSARQFLEAPHFAVVATIGEDGMPHQTVMWYILDGDGLLLNTPNGSVKHQHLKRDPRISVCVEAGYQYVTLSGTVKLDEDPQRARAEYQRLGTHYEGTLADRPPLPPNPDPKLMKLLTSERVSLHMTVERVIGNMMS